MNKITLKKLVIFTLVLSAGVMQAAGPAGPPPPVPPPPPGLPIDTNLIALFTICMVYAVFKFNSTYKKV